MKKFTPEEMRRIFWDYNPQKPSQTYNKYGITRAELYKIIKWARSKPTKKELQAIDKRIADLKKKWEEDKK